MLTSQINSINWGFLLGCVQSNYIIFYLSVNFSLTVGGRFSSEYLDYVKVEVSACKNNTSKNANLTWHPSCANATDMQTYLAKEGSYRVRM
jgi:hypothetical protein